MAGGIAVAIAGRPGRAGFTQTPGRGETCPRAARKQERMRLGRRPKLRELGFVEAEHQYLGWTGIGDRAAEKIGRRAGQREQRRRDQAAGRGLGNGNELAPRLQAPAIVSASGMRSFTVLFLRTGPDAPHNASERSIINQIAADASAVAGKYAANEHVRHLKSPSSLGCPVPNMRQGKIDDRRKRHLSSLFIVRSTNLCGLDQ